MAENFDEDVILRAYHAAIKLRADQVEYMGSLFSASVKSPAIEDAYEKQTGILLEPVIARYWIDHGRIPLTPKNPWKSPATYRDC